jgi:hypothetical protein
LYPDFSSRVAIYKVPLLAHPVMRRVLVSGMSPYPNKGKNKAIRKILA